MRLMQTVQIYDRHKIDASETMTQEDNARVRTVPPYGADEMWL